MKVIIKLPNNWDEVLEIEDLISAINNGEIIEDDEDDEE